MWRQLFCIITAALAFACGVGASSALKPAAPAARHQTPHAAPHDNGAGVPSPPPDFATLRAPARVVGTNAETVEPRSASPYEIARAVRESRERWETRYESFNVDLRRTWERLGVPPGGLAVCGGGNCEAEISLAELDGEPGREVVLELIWFSTNGRYLVFKRAAPGARGEGGWRLLGFADHVDGRHAPPEQRFERTGGRNWLVVRAHEGSGTGFTVYGDTWYEVSGEGVREVLHYPALGTVSPELANSLGCETLSEVEPARGDARAAAVTVSYALAYSTLDDTEYKGVALFTDRRRVRYVWDAAARRFAYDAAGSDVTPEEVEGASGVEHVSGPDGWDVFLKYQCGRVRHAAALKGRLRKREAWLRGLADLCADATPARGGAGSG